MSRTGVETKPPWRTVPAGVRRRAEELLGGPIIRGARVWGGYGPTPSFRLRLADGRTAFFKGTNGASSDFARAALEREERVYRELGSVIGPWAPRFYGAFRQTDWRVLLLEDVSHATIPPWTASAARRVAYAYAGFHAATLGTVLPAWLPRTRDTAHEVTWQRILEESDGLRAIAALAGDQHAESLAWLREASAHLEPMAARLGALPGPAALLHFDTRSDNLRVAGGRLILFDWPSVEVGPPELDLVELAQSITAEGGVPPQRFVAWYGERQPVRPQALDAAVAWLTGYFADRAWRADIPALPRLRRFQRQQLRVLLAWSARRLALAEPHWLDALAGG